MSADDTRSRISPVQEARRIVAVAPHLAELVYAAGAGDYLIAAVRGADFPSQVLKLPSVGDASGLDFERMLSLSPDLVLAWGSGNRLADIARISESGVPVEVFEARHLDDVAQHLKKIGQLAGTEQPANRAAQAYLNRLELLRSRYASADRVRVFVEIWHQPVFSIGSEHLLNDVLHTCGARNTLADYPLLAGPVPLENVIAAAPEVVLTLAGQQERDANARWQAVMPASVRVFVIAIAPDLLTRPSPRMLEGVARLCERIQQRVH